jgi:chromosome segregation ATPase
MNKFEQLIEFVINDDEKNAKALFHEIVVEKSKDIYEDIMSEEEITEKQGYKDREDEHLGAKDGAESGKKQSMKDRRDDEMGKRGKRDAEHDNDQKIDETDLGGSQVDDLIDEVEAEEEGVRMEDEEEEIEMIDVDVDDDDGEEELEDRVVDIEDKLDELMGEFEELMAQVDDNTDDIEGEQDEISDIDSDTDMEQDEIDDMEDEMDEPIDVNVEVEGLEEGVELVAAPKPVTTSPASKSPVAANSGQKGMDAKPVNIDAGNKGAQGRATPKYGDMDATTKPDVKPAPKPELAQASGVNTKSVID